MWAILGRSGEDPRVTQGRMESLAGFPERSGEAGREGGRKEGRE